MARANYKETPYPEKNLIYIVDLYDNSNPTMSVTNDAEQVITEIAQRYDWINERTKFFYKDTEGEIDEIIPTFDGKICTRVKFQFGGEQAIDLIFHSKQ